MSAQLLKCKSHSEPSLLLGCTFCQHLLQDKMSVNSYYIQSVAVCPNSAVIKMSTLDTSQENQDLRGSAETHLDVITVQIQTKEIYFHTLRI